MKTLKFLIVANFLLLCQSISFKEDHESVIQRLNWNRNHTSLITRGKVDFIWNEEKGTHCIAKKDIYKKQFTFYIPKDFIICAFDLYPFKFEFEEAISDYFNNVTNNENNNSTNRPIVPLMAIYLMYLRGDQKEEIKKVVIKNNLTFYNINIPQGAVDYSKSLPETLYTIHMYDEEEYEILSFMGMQVDRLLEYKTMHNHLIEYINKHFHKYSEVMTKLIKDFETFRYFCGLVASRAYRTRMQDYEKLINMPFNQTALAKEHIKRIEKSSKDLVLSCLIPFFDLCNHISTNKFDSENKVDFVLQWARGEVRVALDKTYKDGDEYDYSYIPKASNDKLLLIYGFYDENNPHTVVNIAISVSKSMFSYEKNLLAKEIKLYEHNMDQFYQSDYKTANIQMVINKNGLDNNLLNLIKLIVVSDKYFEENRNSLKKKLLKNKWISYQNEIMSHALYREYMLVYSSKLKLSYLDILYSIHNTRQYYKDNREMIVNNPYLRYKYRMRRRLLNVGKESSQISIKHTELILSKMQEILSDQFDKIKKFYVEA